MTSDVPDRFAIDFVGATLLGVYRVGERLAVGGMGAVYRAENLTLGKPVVVKVPDAALLVQPGFRKRFEQEIRQLVKFNHPNVVSILAAGEHEGVPFFVLDYLAGGSLADRLGRDARVQAGDEVLTWLAPIAGALDALHGRGVVHRDVKPGNILFHEFGQPYLSDFGIAKVLEGGEALTATGGRLFTAAYAAPEQMLDEVGTGPLDGRADQYALAATAYEALGGRPPHAGSTSAIAAAKLRDEPPDLSRLAPHLAPAVSAAIRRAMAREPAARFPSCAAFSAALAASLAPASTRVRAGPVGTNARPAAAPLPPPPTPPRGRRVLLALLALAVLGGGGFLAYRSFTSGGAGAAPGAAAPPTAPSKPPAAPKAPPPGPTPEAPPAQPEPPKPEPWEAPLADALAALGRADGEAARTALAAAQARGAPASRLAELDAFVAAWDRPPVLSIATPAADDAFEATRESSWSVAVRGTLETGRSTDRVRVSGKEARVGAGAFSTTVEFGKPGTTPIVIEVLSGGATRVREVRSVRLVAPPPAAPPYAAFLKGWAEPAGPELDAATGYPQRISRLRDGATMVLIPAGTFWMGRVPADRTKREADEEPRHRVTLTRAYYLDEHEVTLAQFGAFVAATGHKTLPERTGSASANDADKGVSFEVKGATWRDPNPPGEKPTRWMEYPVQRVSHEDAMAFCAWVGAALPTEAQFERALRGGKDGEVYPWGDSPAPPKRTENLCDAAHKRRYPGTTVAELATYDDAWATVAPVMSFLPGPYGLFDLDGNLDEWCLDRYGPYAAGAVTDPTGPTTGDDHVIRGGDFAMGRAEDIYDVTQRSSWRTGSGETGWTHGTTFRGAKTLP